MSVGKVIKKKFTWTLGRSVLDECDEYKFQGEIITNAGSLIPHRKMKEGQINSTVSQAMSVCSDSIFSKLLLHAYHHVYNMDVKRGY